MATEVNYKTTRTYHFDVEIGDKNYTSEMTRFRMVTSLATSWQVFYLDLKLDPFDTILDGGFLGQNPIKIKAFFITEDEIQQEYISFELMIIGGLNSKLTNKKSIGTSEDEKGAQPETILFNLIAVERDAFKKMTTMVNTVTDEGLTVEEILDKLCKEVGLTLDTMDSTSINKNKIPQVVIPPTTMQNAIYHIDESFGIYSGPTFAFCFTEDTESQNSVLYVMNLAAQLKKTEVMTLYQQATDSEENDSLEQKTMDGDKFMVYKTIESNYSGNTKLGVLSKNMNFIIKPKDKLFKLIEKDLVKMCSDVGVIYENDQIEFDENLSDRTRFFIDHPGNDDDETFIDSFIGKEIANMTMIKVKLARNLKIEHFLELGSSVKLETKTAEYQGVGGRYVIFSTDMQFVRNKEWSVTGTLNLIRTNKFSGQ